MNRIISYIKFLLKSKNEHAVHSPFVFNLITKAIYKKEVVITFWTQYQQIRNYFLKNNIEIEVTDFGAGSKLQKSNQRKVSSIAKYAGISNKRAKILFNVVQFLNPNSILEIGTSLGLSTSILSLACNKCNIKTIEGCENTLNLAKNSFQMNQLNNIETICNQFDFALPEVLKKSNFDLVLIDGNHTKKATIHYFELLLQSIHNDTCLIFDDIYWSKEMEEAWKYIHQHPKVTVSIDTYKWGIVFFRKEQEKEHFIIRV